MDSQRDDNVVLKWPLKRIPANFGGKEKPDPEIQMLQEDLPCRQREGRTCFRVSVSWPSTSWKPPASHGVSCSCNVSPPVSISSALTHLSPYKNIPVLNIGSTQKCTFISNCKVLFASKETVRVDPGTRKRTSSRAIMRSTAGTCQRILLTGLSASVLSDWIHCAQVGIIKTLLWKFPSWTCQFGRKSNMVNYKHWADTDLF